MIGKLITMRIRTAVVFVASILVLVVVSTCYYDSEEFLYPQTTNQCDTTNVTYTNSVVPILQSFCISCHSNSSAASLGGNIKLENYADVKVQADNHKLLGSVARENGYSPMPMGASKLEECKITTIRIWVNAGALNN
jgi:hypothetical protein